MSRPEYCPECGRPVLLGYDDTDTYPVLEPEPDQAGDVAVSVDANHVPWCRLIGPDGSLMLGETVYRSHACPLAVVIPFTLRRPVSPQNRRYA